MTDFIRIVNCGGDYDDPAWTSYTMCLKRSKMETTDCYGCNPKPESHFVSCSKCHKVIRVTDDGKHAKYDDHLARMYSQDSKGRWECTSPYLTDIHTCPYCYERDIPTNYATPTYSSSQSTEPDSDNKSWWSKISSKKGWW